MENNNLPKQLSACDILKETTAKELASRSLRVSFSDEIKTRSVSDSSTLNKIDNFDASCSARKESLKDDATSVNVISSEYGLRASCMRNKIEEKISEIEEKINLTSIDSSSESLDFDNSSPDYNAIKVKDSKRSRSCSVSEMRQSTIDRLQSKLEKAEKDLELREEEVSRLRKIRDEVGSEIEDLTASLFEEANNMVKNAHLKRHKAEKSAKEANMKLSMLQEEVRALKSIVQSIKLGPPSVESCDVSDKKSTLAQRSYECFTCLEKVISCTFYNTYPKCNYCRGMKDRLYQCWQVDPMFNKEFVDWRQNPIFDKENPFFKRIYEEDIYPCLNFKNSELSTQVLSAIENNRLIIEKIHCTQNESLPKTCALMDAPRYCPYKMYLDGKDCYNISALSRNRITSICDLFCYFRYIEKGLIKLSIHEVYLEILKKRRRITSAKLGLVDDIIE